MKRLRVRLGWPGRDCLCCAAGRAWMDLVLQRNSAAPPRTSRRPRRILLREYRGMAMAGEPESREEYLISYHDKLLTERKDATDGHGSHPRQSPRSQRSLLRTRDHDGTRLRFARDSLLEGTRFELSVPRPRLPRVGAPCPRLRFLPRQHAFFRRSIMFNLPTFSSRAFRIYLTILAVLIFVIQKDE
jgi:hypothetical protein